jgi:hypothetical protein
LSIRPKSISYIIPRLSALQFATLWSTCRASSGQEKNGDTSVELRETRSSFGHALSSNQLDSGELKYGVLRTMEQFHPSKITFPRPHSRDLPQSPVFCFHPREHLALHWQSLRTEARTIWQMEAPKDDQYRRSEHNSNISQPNLKRLKVKLACQECRDRKIRCDGGRPVCHPCSRKQLGSDRCVYSATDSGSNER